MTERVGVGGGLLSRVLASQRTGALRTVHLDPLLLVAVYLGCAGLGAVAAVLAARTLLPDAPTPTPTRAE